MTRPQKYDPALGLQGNLENALWNNQYNSNNIANNKAISDMFELQIQADFVESVIDEYNSIVEG